MRTAGEFARSRRSGLLITVDEAHVIARLPDLAALAAAMQTVVRRSRLPLAVILAGLPELRSHFHGVGTFLERIETLEVGYLAPDATRYALIQPAADVGVAFDLDALDLLVDASGGYPYLVQVLGYETWTAAGGAARIGLAHAQAGVAAAEARMDGLFRARWDQLSDLEQRYVAAVAQLGQDPVQVMDPRVGQPLEVPLPIGAVQHLGVELGDLDSAELGVDLANLESVAPDRPGLPVRLQMRVVAVDYPETQAQGEPE